MEKNENDEDASDEDDDDEDDIVVTIGDITPASSFNLKQRTGNLLATATATGQDKPKTILGKFIQYFQTLTIFTKYLIIFSFVISPLGKFSIEEFESVGTISGQSAVEYNIEAIEDKPWRKPGADITDYFNYGFNEETWRAYCERQKRMRHESGAGLSGLGPNPLQNSTINSNRKFIFLLLDRLSPQNIPCCLTENRTLTSLTTSENSKYSASGSTNSHSGPPNFSSRGFNATPGLNIKHSLPFFLSSCFSTVHFSRL